MPVEYAATPIRKDGEIVGAVINFSDITERQLDRACAPGQPGEVTDACGQHPFADLHEGPPGTPPARERLLRDGHGDLARDDPGQDRPRGHAPEVADRIVDEDRRVMESARPATFEESVPGPDGTPRDYLTTKVPLLDPNGNVYGMCGIATDITERRHAEEDLKRRRDELQHVNFLADSAFPN